MAACCINITSYQILLPCMRPVVCASAPSAHNLYSDFRRLSHSVYYSVSLQHGTLTDIIETELPEYACELYGCPKKSATFKLSENSTKSY